MGRKNTSFDNQYIINNINEATSQRTSTVQIPFSLVGANFNRINQPYISTIGNEASNNVVTPQGPDYSNWVDVFDFDFGNLAEQDFKSGGDGEYTIGSKTFFARNTANCDSFGINDIQDGLFVDTTTFKKFDLQTRTAPYIEQKISDLSDAFDPDTMSLRLWIYVNNDMDQNNEGLGGGFADFNDSGPTSWIVHYKRLTQIFVFGGGDRKGWQCQKGVTTTETSLGTYEQSGGTDSPNVGVLDFTPATGDIQFYRGDWSSGWPDEGDLISVGTGNLSATFDNLSLFLQVTEETGANNFTGIFKNARLQIKTT